MGFISLEGGYYYEGDRQGQDLIVPDRPDYTYEWNGEAWVPCIPVLLANLRDERKPLLEEADHKINLLEDQGLDSTEVRQYRQALRDMTKNFTAETVSWPTKPW